jgi:hypothetical protein
MLIITLGIERDCSFPAPDSVVFLTTVPINDATEDELTEAWADGRSTIP